MPDPVVITLTWKDALIGGQVGFYRSAEALFRKRASRFPERRPGEFWGQHIEAALAEMCVAQHLGIYWGAGINTFHSADVAGQPLEVRWSPRDDLKIRHDDDDTHLVVSVTGRCPEYRLMGWILAGDAKQEEWYCAEAPPCYFVPHAALWPMATLKLDAVARVLTPAP